MLEASRAAGAAQRQAQWEAGLLDLSLQNPLLCLRAGEGAPLLTGGLAALYEALAPGEAFYLAPRPAGFTGEGFPACNVAGADRAALLEELRDRRLCTLLPEEALVPRLSSLSSSARRALEEDGAGELFLALGLLRWEPPGAAEACYAPLLLFPAELAPAGGGYTVCLRDEEPRGNPVLPEFLRRTYGVQAMGLDPLPHKGSAVDLSEALGCFRRALRGLRCTFVEGAFLGTFPLWRALMWKDLHARGWDGAAPRLLREQSAVAAPAGEQRARTVAARIMEALAQDQTVLYVTKRQALHDAVHRALDEAGLAPFCLSVRGRRSRKREVLEGLRMSAEAPRGAASAALAAQEAQCAALRERLAAYHAALEHPQPCGLTLLSLIDRYAACMDAPDALSFSAQEAEAVDGARFAAWRSLALALAEAGRAVGHPKGHPLSGIRQTQYTQHFRVHAPQSLVLYREALGQLEAKARALCERVELPPPQTKRDYERYAALCGALLEAKALPGRWLAEPDLSSFLRSLRELIARGRREREYAARLSAGWTQDFLKENGEALRREWEAVQDRPSLVRGMGQNKLLRRFAPFSKRPLEKELVEEALTLLCGYQEERDAVQRLMPRCAALLSGLYQGAYTDWERLDALCRQAEALEDRLRPLDGALFRQRSAGIASEPHAYQAFYGTWRTFSEMQAGVIRLFQLDEAYFAPEADYIETRRAACDRWRGALSALPQWVAWRAARAQAEQAGLDCLVKAYEGGLPHEQVLPALEKALCAALLLLGVTASPALAEGGVPDGGAYCAGEASCGALRRRALYARRSACLPDLSLPAAQNSELGILQRAVLGGGRGISVRRLFAALPNLLPRMCPCLMMSPASAAQYLPVDSMFDLVVLDGAEGLALCEAAGALAHGRTAVCAGDPAAAGAEQGLLAGAVSPVCAGGIIPPPQGVAARLGASLQEAGWTIAYGQSCVGFDVDLCIEQSRVAILLDRPGDAERVSAVEYENTAALASAGWRVLRVRALAYWDDPAAETARLLAAVASPGPECMAQSPEAAVQAEAAPVETASEAPSAEGAGGAKTAAGPAPYTPCELPCEPMDPEEYVQPKNTDLVLRRFRQVIEAEAPVLEEVLVRRVLQSLGIARAGSRIAIRTADLLSSLGARVTVQPDGAAVYWRAGQAEAEYRAYRTGGRAAGELPFAETANAAYAVLCAQFGMPRLDLLRETARALGFAQMEPEVIAAMEAGVSLAAEQGRIRLDGGDYAAPVRP